MAVLEDLKPPHVWKYFEQILNIPHCSGNEENLALYVVEEAKRLGLEAKRDEVGNVLVTQPASSGREEAPTIVLQGHLDMVGVCAEGCEHDFDNDPIRPVIDEDFVRAVGTTLGADNGIGGAMMLALMTEKDFDHPEIEHLFTMNEEAGMDGAHGLKAEFVKGRRLINLDTEEFGQYYISCAGGGDSVITLETLRTPPDEGATTFALNVKGLKGGHSGADIHLGRGSANKILARLLAAARGTSTVRIRKVSGGSKRNSIAEKAYASFDVVADRAAETRKAMEDLASVVKEELAKTDEGLVIEIDQASPGDQNPITGAASTKVIDLLIALPHGVLAMSPEIEGLVETSTNVGTLETAEVGVKTVLLTRSAVTSSLPMVKDRIRTIATLAGAKVEEPRGYPGWKPNMDSELLKVGIAVYREIYGEDPLVKAIHAGLECGIFSEKLPGVDMLSIGPSMANVHSPAEELHIPHVEEFYNLLKKILTALA
ncbi:MAG: aminoacyl-histidine dipeptidase [Planctomycetota bacterium]|jgi:dipeptidase D